MLDLFRKRGLSSIVYGVIIVAMILVFVIQFRPNANQKQASFKEACVATVRGWCVDPKDHRAAFKIMIPRDSQGALLTARAKQMGLNKIALDGIIERELLVNEAQRIGLAVTEEEITEEIYNGFIHVSVPSDNPQLAYSLRIADGRVYVGFRDPKTKQFEVKVYERTIRNLVGRSPTEFREEQGREILASKMRDLVRAPVRVSEVEALESYIGEKTSATVSYLSVKQGYVTKYGVNVTEADVAAWAANKDNAKAIEAAVAGRKDSLPNAGHIRHILIRVTPTASADDKAIALAKISEAAARIKRGDAFADVAREMSQDPGSAVHGGDVGDKTDGFVLPFKKGADALKPGEMTPGAIETQFGYHLIMRDDPAKHAEVEAAMKKDAARELYTKSKSTEATKALAAKVLADVKGGKTLNDAALAAIATLTVKPVAAASIAIIRDEPLAPKGDAGVAAKGDAGAAPAAAVPVPAKQLTAENDPDRPQAQSSNAVNHGGDPIPALSPENTAIVSKFAFGAKDGETLADLVHTDDAFLVVQLKEHKAATKEEFDKDRDTYVQTLLAAKQAEALSLYVKRLRETAKSEIKIDDSYLADPNAKDGGAAPAPMEEEEEEP